MLADKISSTAEESNIENIGEDSKEEDNDKPTETPDTNTDDSETSGTSGSDGDDQDNVDNENTGFQERKMTPPMTQIEMNLQNLMIQVAMMIITLNLTTMAQANQVHQIARITLSKRWELRVCAERSQTTLFNNLSYFSIDNLKFN